MVSACLEITDFKRTVFSTLMDHRLRPTCGALVLGAIFGLAFEKSRVFEPGAIRAQFIFSKWLMLKMFLSAVGVGQICICMGNLIWEEKVRETRAKWANECTGVYALVLGAFTLGAGMATAGACPGMVFPQMVGNDVCACLMLDRN